MMKFAVLAAGASLMASVTGLAADEKPQMRLLDDLGFPGEGYCIDVPGVGQSARIDLPLVLHNCLPSRGSVDRVAVERDGRVYMPAYDACVTAFGVVNALPGVPVILRKCGVNESFLEADKLQKFERTTKNQLRLKATNLCLTGGLDAAPTYSSSHRWRTLTLEDCSTAPVELSTWK